MELQVVGPIAGKWVPNRGFPHQRGQKMPSRQVNLKIVPNIMLGNSEGASLHGIKVKLQDTPTQEERAFREQREAFLAIPPLLLAPYQGQFVVSRNGEILDSDNDLPTLTKRFFGQRGDIQVYITQVEPIEEEASLTSFFD